MKAAVALPGRDSCPSGLRTVPLTVPLKLDHDGVGQW